MNPAFSVIFLTTLIGVGQGFFVALYAAEVGTKVYWLAPQTAQFYVMGSIVTLFFLAAGLFASFFHLGRPERAWRAAAMWRTSWLSREVIILPAFIGAPSLPMALRTTSANRGTIAVGSGGRIVTCIALFICTADDLRLHPLSSRMGFTAHDREFHYCSALHRADRWQPPFALYRSPGPSRQLYAKWSDHLNAYRTCAARASRQLARNSRIRPKSTSANRHRCEATRASNRRRRDSWGVRSTRASSSTARPKLTSCVAVKWSFLDALHSRFR